MEALMSPESYQEHVKLYESYRDSVITCPKDPFHLDMNAAFLHKVFFNTVAEPTPPSPQSLLEQGLHKIELDCESLCNAIRDLANNHEGQGWVVMSHDIADKSIHLGCMSGHSDGALLRIPFMALDLYEHAYWMDWGENRAAYVDQFLAVLNWRKIESTYEETQRVSLSPF